MSPRFAGRVVFVSGGSRGLGSVLARSFAAQGAHVYIGYCRHRERAQALADEISSSGGSASAAALDVRDDASVRNALEPLAAELDVLINNAAIVDEQLFATSDIASVSGCVDVNLLGAMRCTRAVLRGMFRRPDCSVLNIASVAALRAHRGLVAYATSKAGLIGFTRSLAAEVASHGVRVNAIAAGILDLGMGARSARSARGGTEPASPLGRPGRALEVASAALFLASPEASYITGEVLVVDGGLSL